jgi:folate-binding protein YgfZ
MPRDIDVALTGFASLPGAVLSDFASAEDRAATEDTDAHVSPAHFGGPLLEQRALAEGRAAVELGHRGAVRVSGPDRLRWLDTMTSQQLNGLQPGDSAETLLLDPNGRIEHAIRVVDDGVHTWLMVDEGEADGLTAYLTRMRFTLRVEVLNVSNETVAYVAFAAAPAASQGPALDALRAIPGLLAEWRDPWAEVVRGGHQYAAPDEHPAIGWSAHHLLFARSAIPAITALARSGSLQAAGMLSLDALEVRAWRPSVHGEVDARSLPHEFDWLRSAVHLTKGCYRGQETVAKVHNLGHPPRRLTQLFLDGSEINLPAQGSLVFVAGAAEDARPVGRVTRAANHYEWGGVALALLKRSTPAEAVLEIRPEGASSIGCAQEAIVPSDAGATRDIPRLRRL